MFAKLLKHYLKEQRGLMLMLSGAALAIGLLGGALSHYLISAIQNGGLAEHNATLEGTLMLILMGMYFALYAYMIGVFIYQLYCFYRRHFTDEGYLTFTLPVTTHQLLLSSICNVAIWLTVSGLVMMLSWSMIYLPLIKLSDPSVDIQTLFSMMNSQGLREVMNEMGFNGFLVALLIISALLSGLILPLASITIGSLVAKKHKLLASFGIYYGINFGISTLQGILSVVSIVGDVIRDDVPSFGSMFLSMSVVFLIIAAGGYFLMHHLMKKKLNLQ